MAHCATTLALTLGSLAVPAAALADGQLDPAFNGTGYHVGSATEGTLFSQLDNRVPMVVQADNSIVIGGSRNGFMTLARYTPTVPSTRRSATNGFVDPVRRHALQPGRQRGDGDDADAGGDIIVAGFGGSQSMVVARFSQSRRRSRSVTCLRAPPDRLHGARARRAARRHVVTRRLSPVTAMRPPPYLRPAPRSCTACVRS